MTGEGHLWGEGSNYPPIRAVLQGKVQMWVHSSQHLQTERGRWVQHYRCATTAWCILDLQGQPLSPRPYILSKTAILDFLGSTVDENPPSNSGDPGSIPGLRRSHMPRSNWACVPQLLSLCSRVHKLQLLKPVHSRAHATQEKSLQWEAHAPQLKSSPACRN